MNARTEMPPAAPERRQSTPRALRGLAVAAAVFALLAGYVLHRWRDAATYPLRAVSDIGNWIQAPGGEGYAGFFRRRLHLPANVTSAWITVTACDGFEVIVNGNPVARQYLWRPTRPFQNGLSEKGQRLAVLDPAVGLNFPREYQWSGHDTYRFPVLVDIRPELNTGRNVICVQIESRRAPAKFAMAGEIILSTGQRIALNSRSLWKAEPVPPGLQDTDWTDPSYGDQAWRMARSSARPRGRQWRDFDTTLFARPFAGVWLKHPRASSREAIFFARSGHLNELHKRRG